MPYHCYGDDHKNYLKSVCTRIQQVIYTPVAELNTTAWITREPVTFAQRKSGRKKSVKIGSKWGKLWDCAWFNFTGTVPAAAAGKNVVLLIDVNGEACVVDDKGSPVLGLTSVKSPTLESLGQPGKKVVEFTARAQGKEKVNIWIDAGCNSLFGTDPVLGTLLEAHIAVFNKELQALFYDFALLHELLGVIPQEKARYHSILNALTQAAHELFDYTEAEARRARKHLAPELNKKGGDPSLTISAVGNAHLDLAWLWPIRETIRKGARTFATALHLMDRYPDYVFGASQPQLYQWIKDQYPALYKKVKKRVAEGRWDLHGAMWVEADLNVSGGEALVRQILYGKRFFKKEFGRDINILWLPDVFGFSGAIPQLCRKSGIDYFLTTKMSWSEFNKFPHHTFNWQGIDGSKILAHMPPDFNYSSSAAPASIHSYEKTFADKLISDRILLLFGIGDGGGGPGAEHLEALQREKNLDGIAPVVQETAENFFRKIDIDRDRYKTWVGELYLEKHRGTYTNQGRSKRCNRKMELALRELEWSSVLGSIYTRLKYPNKKLDEIWKETLLYQFHDILPGSSITRVYDESLAGYERMLRQTEQLTQTADNSFVAALDTADMKKPVVVTNSLSWQRKEWIQTGNRWFLATVPPMGYKTYDIATVSESDGRLSASPAKLENDILRVNFARDGAILSIYDKQNQRDVLVPGAKANQLIIYEDMLGPLTTETWGHDNAWDFPIHYDEKNSWRFQLETAQAETDGPRAILKQTYSFGNSKLNQQIILTAGSRRIDFVTEVDWKEAKKMLRTSFPVDVLTSEATCDIQFGNLRRPTHRNTSWDMAKYEICAHKWTDLSQPDYGVAMMSDCKYGYKVADKLLDLALLRSSGFPDPKSDRARHQFTYSLYPHSGNHITGGVIRAGYELNIPLRTIPLKPKKGSLPLTDSFLSVDAENVIIETVKKAHDNNDIIVRLYECRGASAQTTLQWKFPIKSAQLVDLMEENPKKLAVKNQSVKLDFGPFEIHTVKLIRK